jgi:transcriptional regulator NrdR family protein
MPAVQVPCPNCDFKTSRVISTSNNDNGEIIRYRKCFHCDYNWYTLQHAEVFISRYKLSWKNKKAFITQTITN